MNALADENILLVIGVVMLVCAAIGFWAGTCWAFGQVDVIVERLMKRLEEPRPEPPDLQWGDEA